MAFRMNRPIIKGTPLHKASVAKAKSESIVSQSRTQADSGLIAAASAMGKALVPGEVDFSLDQTIDGIGDARGGRKKKEVKGLTDEQKAAAAEKLRKENLKKEYDKEHPGGTLFQDGKYYDASGNEVKQKKVKEEKTPTDNMFNDVDADGNVVSRLFGRARQAANQRRADSKAKQEASQIEKEKLNAEKLKVKTAKEEEQAKIEAGKQAELNKELEAKNKLREAKTTASTDYTVNKRDLVLNGGNWVPKKGAVSKEDDRAIWDGEQWTDNPKYMDKGDVVNPDGKFIDREKVGSVADWDPGEGPKVEAFGGKQINQYTKEQRSRLETEGVWSDKAEKMVLPEEIVDGEFVSKAEGTKLEVVATDPSGNNQTNNTVVEKEDQNTTTTRTREQKENDKIYNDFRTSEYMKKKMIEGGYTPIQSKSPMEMRDDRVYRNARADGPVRKNMIKGGYKPQN